jgi:hypothetical protein
MPPSFLAAAYAACPQDLLLERLRQDTASQQLLAQQLMPLILAGQLAPRTGAEWALSRFLEYASG